MDRPGLPYSSVTIDSSLSHIMSAVSQCFSSIEQDVVEKKENLSQIWMSQNNKNSVLACLSVRSGLDLFLQTQAYPPGSEVIMTAVNIEEMADVLHHHNLKVVPVDINICTLEPKSKIMEKLITPRTVAFLTSHLYGRRMDMEPVISLAKKYKVHVMEDCAECFSGFSYLGHPESDISLFSFGAIKFLTSFGGSIVKVKDKLIYEKMNQIQASYPRQTNFEYLKKVLKYGIMFSLLHVKPFPQITEILRQTGHDYKELFISYLRGFPSYHMINIRKQPSPALISVMASRHANFDMAEFDIQRIKGEYFLNGLTEEMWPVGTDVKSNSIWLFPVIVENPEEVIKSLASLGMDAYRGTTQLKLIEPDDASMPIGPNCRSGQMVSAKERYPHEAKYMMDHIIYLPINKHVPFWALDKMMQICSSAMLNLTSKGSSVSDNSGKEPAFIKSRLKSKM